MKRYGDWVSYQKAMKSCRLLITKHAFHSQTDQHFLKQSCQKLFSSCTLLIDHWMWLLQMKLTLEPVQHLLLVLGCLIRVNEERQRSIIIVYTVLNTFFYICGFVYVVIIYWLFLVFVCLSVLFFVFLTNHVQMGQFPPKNCSVCMCLWVNME